MTFIERLKKIEQIDQLIRLKTTGNMCKFSSKIKLSERQMWRYIDDLKGLGAEIEYSKESDSYVYKTPFNYNLGVGEKIK
jgi:biotin operon repressor